MTTNVLIVDDDPEEVTRLAKWLEVKPEEYVHFNPRQFIRGKQALQFDAVFRALLKELQKRNPTVVILDLQLHESVNIGGQEFCRELRNRCPGLGLVCVTIMPQAQVGDQGKQWGADRVWTKGWSIDGKISLPGEEARILRDLINNARHAVDCGNFDL